MNNHDPFSKDLADDDPELYGLLLLADQKIGNVGTSLVWILMIGALGLCVALHMHWLDDLTGRDFGAGRGIGVYVLICVSAFAAFAFMTSMMERSKYRGMREEILDSLQRSNRSVYKLIAEIQNDEQLSNIAEQIKDDKGINVKSRSSEAIR